MLEIESFGHLLKDLIPITSFDNPATKASKLTTPSINQPLAKVTIKSKPKNRRAKARK